MNVKKVLKYLECFKNSWMLFWYIFCVRKKVGINLDYEVIKVVMIKIRCIVEWKKLIFNFFFYWKYEFLWRWWGRGFIGRFSSCRGMYSGMMNLYIMMFRGSKEVCILGYY